MIWSKMLQLQSRIFIHASADGAQLLVIVTLVLMTFYLTDLKESFKGLTESVLKFVSVEASPISSSHTIHHVIHISICL
jgi:hypothetical protein